LIIRGTLDQRWDLTDVDGTLLIDLTAGSQAARAAEYMAGASRLSVQQRH